MRTIAIANQKGGCGKTTTAINLSSSLSVKGKRVLLIDCDPQAHATMGLNRRPLGLGKSIYHVMTLQDNGAKGIEDIIVPIKDNFDLAPSSIILCALEQELAGMEGREDRLHQAIQAIQRPYDYIVIDCPPSIGLLSINALRACREVIIPIDMSLFSLRGVIKLIEIILLIKDRLGHEIKPRALITMYDFRTRYAKHVMEKVKERFGNNVFESVIRYNVRLRETVDYGLPIGDYDKHSIGYKDYEGLAEEVIRSEGVDVYDRENAQLTAQDILLNAERYIDSVAELLENDHPAAQPGEATAEPLRSSYPETMEAHSAELPDTRSEERR
jgi:chromosome partitioning protein